MFGRKQSEDLSERNTNKVAELYREIEKSNFTVAITGAGISIAAGGVSYAGMGARGGMRMHSGNPDAMYKALYSVFMEPAFKHGPTEAHKGLARLEEMGKLQGIITTNEDCIHTMAGSKNVAEIQGSFQVNTCNSCGKRVYGYEIWNEGHMPKCPDCGGTLLPWNIYSHISLLQEDVAKAREWMRQAELIIIIGTSGYYGGAYWDCKRPGARIVQINPKATHFDAMAKLNIHQGADPVFTELMKMYEKDAPKAAEETGEPDEPKDSGTED